MKNLLLGVFLFAAACTAKPFIVVEQAAASPSFTVVPYDGDTDFSRKVEREILALGFRVLERPELKYISTDAKKTESSGVATAAQYGRLATGESSSESVTASLYKVDIVAMYPEAKSDYIVVVYSKAEEMRILKKSDLSLVASGEYDSVYYMSDFVRSIFAHAKFISGETVEKKCETVKLKKVN